MQKPKVIAIVGPTSSGKTSLSIEIAKKFNGEVISADSRQVYKGMDIGTGKVTTEEMGDVPHHLLDVVEPMNVYTAADFERDSLATTEDIVSRNRLPVFAGGTFFYLDILRGKMQPAPVEPNPTLRAELEKLSDQELLEKLQASDPKRAESIDPDNRRRIIRSLEIIDALGAVPKPVVTDSQYDWLILGIDIEKEKLHHNIHARLLQRIEEGMIEEAKRLHQEGISFERMDELGLEYRYLAKLLKKEITEEEMIPELETKIKQFAKRQLTWLKRDKEIVWVEPKNYEVIFRLVADFLSE
tara:strand:+ start:1817 stop:2713 length:897 start_codon:yes stop_codon:yes gene_type:complete